LTSGQVLRLEMGSLGLGETNKLVSAALGTDSTFVWDGDALNFLTNANVNITDAAAKSAVNALVVSAKNSGWWTNCDCIYPLLGPAGGTTAQISNACRISLKNPAQFAITWHGTPVFDANGVTGDGSGAYGDITYNLTGGGHVYVQNSAHLFVYGGTTTPTDNGVFIGASPNNSLAYILRSSGSGGLTMAGLNSFTGNAATAAASDFRGPMIGIRTSSTQAAVAVGATYQTVTSSSTTDDFNGDPFLLSRNNGSPANLSNANLRGATVGGGMTQAQWDTFRADWDNFEQALGRKAP
jgi:hypothetical protein